MCDTNRAAQSLKKARGLKFRIYEEEVLYYPCSENKGADQLPSNREADLRLCFRICKKQVFSRSGSYESGNKKPVFWVAEQVRHKQSWPQGYNTFLCSTQLKF